LCKVRVLGKGSEMRIVYGYTERLHGMRGMRVGNEGLNWWRVALRKGQSRDGIVNLAVTGV